MRARRATMAGVDDERLLLPHPHFRTPGRAFMPLDPDQREAVAAFNARVHSGGIAFEVVPCLCGAEQLLGVARVERHGVLQRTALCPVCGLVQSSPRMATEALDAFYSSDEYRRIYDGADFVVRYEQRYADGLGDEVFSRVTGWRPADELTTVMEFGAGGGWNLLPFRDAGIEVRGYELSPELVSLGQTRGLPLERGGLDVVEGRYDAVIVHHVLEHLPDPVAALRHLARHVREDGFLAVSVPNIRHFHARQLQNAHTYYFAPETLRHYAARAGLRTVRLHDDDEGAHMTAILVVEETAPEPLDAREMLALIQAYAQQYRFRLPRAVAARAAEKAAGALGRFGLSEPARRALGRT